PPFSCTRHRKNAVPCVLGRLSWPNLETVRDINVARANRWRWAAPEALLHYPANHSGPPRVFQGNEEMPVIRQPGVGEIVENWTKEWLWMLRRQPNNGEI